MTSCSAVTPPLVEEPQIDLIREYTGRNVVVRWADGIVPVCDTTEKTEAIWGEINKIINGPVIFQLTDDTAAQIGIGYWNINDLFVAGGGIEDFKFMWFGICINPIAQNVVYEQVCLMAAGIKEEKAAEGFSDEVKTVLYWLYRLEPGYPLM